MRQQFAKREIAAFYGPQAGAWSWSTDEAPPSDDSWFQPVDRRRALGWTPGLSIEPLPELHISRSWLGAKTRHRRKLIEERACSLPAHAKRRRCPTHRLGQPHYLQQVACGLVEPAKDQCRRSGPAHSRYTAIAVSKSPRPPSPKGRSKNAKEDLPEGSWHGSEILMTLQHLPRHEAPA